MNLVQKKQKKFNKFVDKQQSTNYNLKNEMSNNRY